MVGAQTTSVGVNVGEKLRGKVLTENKRILDGGGGERQGVKGDTIMFRLRKLGQDDDPSPNVMNACNPGTWEAEAGLKVPD